MTSSCRLAKAVAHNRGHIETRGKKDTNGVRQRRGEWGPKAAYWRACAARTRGRL